MPHDPNTPADHAELTGAMLRGKFNGLNDLIEALQSVTAAQIDAVNTLPPGDPASVSVSVVGDTLHFSFDLPQGAAGVDGNPGADGAEGPPGPEGTQGPPGEVTALEFVEAIAGTSSNSNAVDTLGMVVSDPPTQSEVQDIVNKLDELITALRR